MNYNIRYKSLDGRDVTDRVLIEDFLTGQGYRLAKRGEVENWNPDPDDPWKIYIRGSRNNRLFFSVDTSDKSISKWYEKIASNGLDSDYIKPIREELQFFDNLGYHYDTALEIGLVTQGMTGASIEDWYDE